MQKPMLAPLGKLRILNGVDRDGALRIMQLGDALSWSITTRLHKPFLASRTLRSYQ